MKLRGFIGVVAVCILVLVGWTITGHRAWAEELRLAVETPPSGTADVFKLGKAFGLPAADTAQVVKLDKDFVLPPADNALPVYDAYTLQQRRERGLPLTYYRGTEREYYYGDHVVYLTFDDGPNKENTQKILDILKSEDVRATFFLVGKNVENNPQTVKRIYQEGHAIGLHSYSHDYAKLYASAQAYTDEMEKTEQRIYQILHVRPIISRAPGGTAGHFTAAHWQAVRDLGYIEVGWNALNGDADGSGKTSSQELENIRSQLEKRPYLNTHLVILMHDSAGHGATVNSLPDVIHLLKEKGYTFRVVTPAIPPSW